jgi:hypothetical protein
VTNLVVPVYYDLKEGNQWEPDFEALEKLDLTKKSCGLVSTHANRARGSLELFEN